MRLELISALLAVLMSGPPAWAEQSVPSGVRWIEHLNNDLLPFWTAETALGNSPGAFPTIRCDDRTLYNEQKPCTEIGRRFSPYQRSLVALSRQSYGYGVAFHLTGNRAYLDLMKAGIDFIRHNAMDRLNGGMATTQDVRKGTWGPTPDLRTPQQLAYGLLGMAFYYYLTRDPDVLQDITSTKDYIFKTYGSSTGALLWQSASGKIALRVDKQLVAQLDQMNTYLVLLTPILPKHLQDAWKEDLVRLSTVMMDQFYSPTDKLFFKASNQPGDKSLARTPTDFGHTAKAFWMIRWAGIIAERNDLISFAQDNGQALLARAYLEECGCWAGGALRGGALDLNKPWWIYAELDQFAGTLALGDRKFAFYLPKAYEYWFDRFVDKDYGEVWNIVDGKTHAPIRQSPKQWEWKNAYHTFEHALVGYIVGQALNGQAVTLYYALPDNALAQSTQPYFYSGKVQTVEVVTDIKGLTTQKITFDNIH